MSKNSFRFVASGTCVILQFAAIATLFAPQPADAAIECVPGTVTRNAQGRITQCQLAQSNHFAHRMFSQNKKPTEEFDCRGQQLIRFHPTGAVAFCTLDKPISIIQDGVRDQCLPGMRIFFTDKGLIRLPNWCNKP